MVEGKGLDRKYKSPEKKGRNLGNGCEEYSAKGRKASPRIQLGIPPKFPDLRTTKF